MLVDLLLPFVQLCVGPALALPPLYPLLVSMQEQPRQLSCKEMRLRLNDTHLAANTAEPRLLRPCDTRCLHGCPLRSACAGCSVVWPRLVAAGSLLD